MNLSLKVGQTCKFRSSLDKDLVRTGTVADGSCFFHSLFTANEHYRNIAKEDSRKATTIIKNYRKNLADELTMDEWETFGEVSIEPFITKLRKLFKKIYKDIRNEELNEFSKEILEPIFKFCDKDDIKTMLDIVSWSKFSKELFPYSVNKVEETMRSGQNLVIKEIIKQIIDTLLEFFEKKLIEVVNDRMSIEEVKFIVKKYELFLSEIFKNVKDNTFENYKNKLGDSGEWVDQYLLGYLSSSLNRNIYIIDYKTALPYKEAMSINNYKDRKNLIILYLENEGHYECIGKIKDNEDRISVQRVFNSSDELIQKIHSSLVN